MYFFDFFQFDESSELSFVRINYVSTKASSEVPVTQSQSFPIIPFIFVTSKLDNGLFMYKTLLLIALEPNIRVPPPLILEARSWSKDVFLLAKVAKKSCPNMSIFGEWVTVVGHRIHAK